MSAGICHDDVPACEGLAVRMLVRLASSMPL
jgi:hypothetical protein